MICCVVNCAWRWKTSSSNPLDCEYTQCPFRDGSKIIDDDGTVITVETHSKGIKYEDEMRKDMEKLNDLAAEILDITDKWIT